MGALRLAFAAGLAACTRTEVRPTTGFPEAETGGDTSASDDTSPPADIERPAADFDKDGDGYPFMGPDGVWDCDDADPAVHPGADEVCQDGIDQNCDYHDYCVFETVSASTAWAEVMGAEAWDLVGAEFEPAGDQNGDGIQDVWAGRPRCDEMAEPPGMIQLVHGPIGPGVSVIPEPTDSAIAAQGEESCLGAKFESTPDANGDGVPELAFSLYDDEVDGLPEVGRVFLLLSPIELPSDSSASDAVWEGESEQDNADAKLASPTDFFVEGDHYLLIGTYAGSEAGRGHAAYLVPLAPTTERESLADADIRFLGEDPWDAAGYSVGALGDLDGDGLGDIGIGAPLDDTETPNGGAAYVVLGGAPPGSFPLGEADGKWTGRGWSVADRAARKVEPAGDFDGDGLADLLVASCLAQAHCDFDGSCDEAGKTWVVLGPATGRGSLAGAWLLVEGWYWRQNSGESVAAGDLDLDGRVDLVIGAPYEATNVHGKRPVEGGVVHVFHGPLSGFWTTDRADLHLQAEGGWNNFGGTVTVTGGFVEPGSADLMVGASANEENGHWTGALYVFGGL